MPWGGAGGQNVEHPHTLAILSSFIYLFILLFFFCFKCIFVLLARCSSGEIRCSATALIHLYSNKCPLFFSTPSLYMGKLCPNAFKLGFRIPKLIYIYNLLKFCPKNGIFRTLHCLFIYLLNCSIYGAFNRINVV